MRADPHTQASLNTSAAASSALERWLGDFIDAARDHEFWTYLARQDIRIRYRRSKIGPLWITLSMAIFIVALGNIYGRLFNADTAEYLPFLACSFVTWGFISTYINDAPAIFVQNSAYLTDVKTNPVTILLRSFARNLIVLGHNAVIILGVYLWFNIWPGWAVLLAVPGIALVALNLFALSVPLAIVGARFRDVDPIVHSAVQIAFFITPIMWLPRLVGPDSLIILLNPAAYFLEIVRGPLLGEVPGLRAWGVSLLCLAVSSSVALWLYRRKRARIPFWV